MDKALRVEIKQVGVLLKAVGQFGPNFYMKEDVSHQPLLITGLTVHMVQKAGSRFLHFITMHACDEQNCTLH